MNRRIWGTGILLLMLSLGLAPPGVEAAGKRSAITFGTLEAVPAEEAQAQAEAWLKQVGKGDAQTLAQFRRIWAEPGRSVLERVAQTLALGDEQARRLLAEAADPEAPAPTEVPALLKNEKLPPFYRANLTLAYARLLSNRRIHEEALAALRLIRPEEVVEPATYLFHRAVCEHALLQKAEATRTLTRLLEETNDVPERYRTLAALMLLDMQTWKSKDLGEIARKMNNVERRLELARGGPETQKLQKEIVFRLDEIIKELENKAKNGSSGSCPGGGSGSKSGSSPAGGPSPTNPMPDSRIATNGGRGTVDQKKFRELQERWGTLPERERARALQELTRGLTNTHREAIENYFRSLSQALPRR